MTHTVGVGRSAVSGVTYVLCNALLFCRLAAAMGLQCALILSAAQHHGTADSQHQDLCWSPAAAAEAFETVLWALSWYPEVLHSEAHSVADTLQQLKLHEGDPELASARLHRLMHGRSLLAASGDSHTLLVHQVADMQQKSISKCY